jgi:3-phosphoshikimate 1-carboxyvinyltransferase
MSDVVGRGELAALPDPFAVEPAVGRLHATVRPPGSKSITNRALVCALLAEGTSTLEGILAADDTEAMVAVIERLGATVRLEGDRAVVGGVAGRPQATGPLDARQSGTTARFVLPLLALATEPATLDGHPQLRARPMGPALEALAALGARVTSSGGGLPVTVAGPIRGGSVALGADTSSQFLSGLLLAGPALAEGLDIELTTELVSEPYVEMTMAVMRAFGAEVERVGRHYRVAPGGYRAGTYRVEPDASAASYPWAAAAVCGGSVTVAGLGSAALQGDVGVVEVLAAMGAEVERGVDSITVRGTGRLEAVTVDLRELSDTVPTVAVVAAFARGTTRIEGVGFIRAKESDRIGAVVAELTRLGVTARELPDGLEIVGGGLHGGVVKTYQDHRMAMAFAVAGLRVAGVAIADPGCVAKTYPGYWAMLARLRSSAR